MYASHLIIESPSFLSNSAVMEQMPGARLFLMRLSSTSQLVTGSVCESASGVAWSASRWSLASVASHDLFSRSLKRPFHLHRQSLILVSLVPSSAWTVVDWLLRPSLHVRSSRKTVCWSCLATADSIAAAFASQYLPWSRPSARFLSLVSRLTSGLSPRSRAALRYSIMLRVGFFLEHGVCRES